MLNHLNINHYEREIDKHRLHISVNQSFGYRNRSRNSCRINTHIAFGVELKAKLITNQLALINNGTPAEWRVSFVLSNEYSMYNPFVVLNLFFLCYSMEICSMTRRIPFYINKL